jgi:hypothetical protein
MEVAVAAAVLVLVRVPVVLELQLDIPEVDIPVVADIAQNILVGLAAAAEIVVGHNLDCHNHRSPWADHLDPIVADMVRLEAQIGAVVAHKLVHQDRAGLHLDIQQGRLDFGAEALLGMDL